MHSWHVCFFFNDTATTEIYTLSLHDALPIWEAHLNRRFFTTRRTGVGVCGPTRCVAPESLARIARIVYLRCPAALRRSPQDRKSTRLNSSHGYISYAVFCLKKKKNNTCRPLH